MGRPLTKLAAIALAAAFVWPGAFIATLAPILAVAAWLSVEPSASVRWLLVFAAICCATAAACLVYQKVLRSAEPR